MDRGIATACVRTSQLLLEDCPRRVSRPRTLSLGFDDLEVGGIYLEVGDI